MDNQVALSDYFVARIATRQLVGVKTYLALHTSHPTALGLLATEVAGGGYRRQRIRFGLPANRICKSITAQTFIGMPACRVTHLGVWDDPVAGHLLFVVKLNPALGVRVDGHFLTSAGDVVLNLDQPGPVEVQLPPVDVTGPEVPPLPTPVPPVRPTPAPPPAPTPTPTPIPPAPAVGGFTLVSEDQFASLDPAAWHAYDNSTFGAPTRVQLYLANNVVTGAGSAGSTGGTSLKLLSKRESIGGHAYTAGMLDSKTAGRFAPRYCRLEARMKIPHGQGLWPAWWLTARLGGANMIEFDLMEYFHSQLPGKLTTTLHRADNSGKLVQNLTKASTFFEAPTLTPGWHTITVEITPDSGDVNAPNAAVRFKVYLDGVLYFNYLDTSALYWSTNGGDADSFWNVYVQGCQIDGNWVGSPDGPLGYSHWLNRCLAGGTAPNACTTTVGGHAMQLPTFGDPSSTFELDYHKVWKYAA